MSHPLRIFAIVTLVSLPNAALAQATVTYEYDALGRLKTATISGGPTNGTATNYSYDSAGNRAKVVTDVPTAGGNCTFSVRDEWFSYDWEFPSNRLPIWIDISGSCGASTTMEYAFSVAGVSSGTFVVHPSQTSYYYYDLPAPCTSVGNGDITTTIRLISGPGNIVDNSARLRIEGC